MRLAALLVIVVSSTAFADHSIPMTAIAKADVCTQLSTGIDKATCTSAKHETIASVGDVELWVARGSDKVRYAMTIGAAGKLYISGTTELAVSDVCTDRGSEKCTFLVSDVPKLRSVKPPLVGDLATFELATQYKHTSVGAKSVLTNYDAYDVIVCGKSDAGKQDLVCQAKHWGGTMTSSCKGVLSDTGSVELTCHERDAVSTVNL